jgi:hypothetical protein
LAHPKVDVAAVSADKAQRYWLILDQLLTICKRERRTSRHSVRARIDHLPMKPAIRVLAWLGVIATAAVAAAFALSTLLPS